MARFGAGIGKSVRSISGAWIAHPPQNCPSRTLRRYTLAVGQRAATGCSLLAATDELLADGRAREVTWRRLVEQLGTHQAMELIFIVGTYGMLAMDCDTWGLAPAPGSVKLYAPDANPAASDATNS